MVKKKTHTPCKANWLQVFATNRFTNVRGSSVFGQKNVSAGLKWPCIEWPKGLAPKCVFANANKLLGFLWGLLIELSWGAEYYGSQWNNSFATQLRSQCLH